MFAVAVLDDGVRPGRQVLRVLRDRGRWRAVEQHLHHAGRERPVQPLHGQLSLSLRAVFSFLRPREASYH